MAKHREYVNAVIHQLASKTKQDKRSVDKLALSFGISDPTQVKELTELAIVLTARHLAHQNCSVKERFDMICYLYHNQVNLSHRTSQSLMFQQYSTPAPLSFLASMYVLQNDFSDLGSVKRGGRFTKNHFKPTETKKEPSFFDELTEIIRKQSGNPLFFEPSAGNGLLTIALPPELTVVNEIDDTRYRNLLKQPFYEISNYDATEAFTNYQRFFKGVVSNPPFGTLHDTVMYGDFGIKHLDHLMALRALDTMQDNGRAAIIIGGHTAWDSEGRIQKGKNRIFLSYLYKHYYVQDIINIDGGLYSRQGTSFDVRLILIDGRKSEPEGYAPLYSSFDTTVKGFDELYNRVNLKNETGMDINIIRKLARLKLYRLQNLSIDGIDGAYRPVSEPPLKPLDTVVPDSMDYEVHSALLEVKDEVGGSINAYVRGYLGYNDDNEMARALSAEQVDAVAMTVYNIEEKGQAMIIGDQTGIGKGRVAAAVIRYACKLGLKPIFITEKANLFSDMYRDLSAIGSAALRPFIVNGNESKTKVKDEDGNVIYEPLERSAQEVIFDNRHIGNDFDYIMLTYSQIASNKPTNKQTFINELAKNNVLILDESHNAGGDLSTSATARFFFNVVKEAKGVLFLSATFAKRSDNMPVYASKTCMSDASLSNEGLVEAINKGGVALQEVLSANLVAEGQMLRRERSFEGIEVNYITLDTEGSAKYNVNDKEHEHRAIVDNITEVLRAIIRFQSDYVDPVIKVLDKMAKMTMTQVEKRKGTQELGVSATPFFSKVFNVVNQMLFSVKADEVAERAIARLKEGKAPIIAFSSTMGAFLEDMEDERGQPVQDGTMINADFAEVLKRGLSGILRYTELDEAGKSKPKFMSISELPIEAQTEYARISKIIEEIATGISISPIDRIKFKLQQAGYTLAEVTGRKLEVRFEQLNSNVGMVATRRKELVNDAFRKFNNNEVDVLLINQSGSTGASAHAIVTPKVSISQIRQRVMIVLQTELDINREVQKRGRINRTGQVYKPIYDYVTSAIPAEKRMSMMLQKKLKSLDANTTSNQRNSEALLQSDDFLNKYGDKLVLDFLLENPLINDEIGDPLKLNDKDADITTENAASKVSGRVAVLPTTDQDYFYLDMIERYRAYINYLLQTGEYDLEVEAMDLQADTIERQLKIAGKGGSKSFGGNTYLEKCEVNILKKPFGKTELDNLIKEALGSKTAQEHTDELMKSLSEFMEVRRLRDYKDVEERADKASKNISNEKKYQALQTAAEQKKYFEGRLKEIEEAKTLSIENADNKIRNQKQYLEKFFNFFKIGEGYYYTENAVVNPVLVPSVFLGFRVNYNKPNPFAPSGIYARFAVASSNKYFEFALSGEQAAMVDKFIVASYRMSSYDKQMIVENWNEHIKKASVDRGTRFIYTGNLLQAYGEIAEKSKLISYTTNDGRVLKGILMPESWKDESMSSTRKTVVPLFKALPVIKQLKIDQQLKTDTSLIIIRQSQGFVVATSSLSVQRFDYILKNPDILKYIISKEGFQKAGNAYKGGVLSENIDKVIRAIYDASNCTVELNPEQLAIIEKDLLKEDFKVQVFPKLVELEVKLFAMIKGQNEGFNGLSGECVNLSDAFYTLRKFYPYSITSERSKIISDMISELEQRTSQFTDLSVISNEKIEVRYLLEKEHVKPADWIEYKHTFKRSEEDVVIWLANEVQNICNQSQHDTDKEQRMRIAKAKAMAKMKLLKLLQL